jgi:chorismate synthase
MARRNIRRRVRGYLAQIGDVVPRTFDWNVVEQNPFFWPDATMVEELENTVNALRKSGDSVGARVTSSPTACRRAGASRSTASSTATSPRR